MMVEQVFSSFLSQHKTLIAKNLNEFEHVSLKYISYLAKIRKNPLKSYCQLKMLLSRQRHVSIYF